MIKEWENEKDFYEFTLNGIKCEIKRIEHLGHLCGYLYLPDGHEFIKLFYDDIPICVHGDLSFKEENKIGFDCAHGGDLIPKYGNDWSGTEYRNVEFVKNELRKMVEQVLNYKENRND